ncbi:MAG: TetR/AcrR family transcriptional repressor of nem operon [Candidatus Promineifilaceae bacterium]|jgi:TetR/AcrR family transcriptional repressor of nem operon
MARPREYIRADVLEAATALFWERGYEATSMNALVEKTGLNKQSMYSEFVDKEGLFLACIDHYQDGIGEETARLLTKAPIGIANIQEFLEQRVHYAATSDCKGCLVVSTASNNKTIGPRVSKKTESMLFQFRGLIQACLEAAQEAGDLSQNADCEALAGFFDCHIRGLMNIGKGPTQLDRLQKMNAIALSVLST